MSVRESSVMTPPGMGTRIGASLLRESRLILKATGSPSNGTWVESRLATSWTRIVRASPTGLTQWTRLPGETIGPDSPSLGPRTLPNL